MVRSSLLALASSLILGSVAMAADLPSTKGPPAYQPPPPEFSWSGIYIGGNAGISAGAFNLSSPLGLPGTTERATGAGFSGGGQIGVNYQFPTTNFVVGVETDLQGSTLRGTYMDASVPPETESFGTNVNWWGTARGRLGYAFGNILPYVTGGFAYGHANDFISFTGGGPGVNYSYSWSSTRTGWTAGAGLEYALTHNLTVKAEYLYTDFGSWSYDGNPFPAGDYVDTRVAFHTVRVGLNWKFDPWWAAPAPVVAKY